MTHAQHDQLYTIVLCCTGNNLIVGGRRAHAHRNKLDTRKNNRLKRLPAHMQVPVQTRADTIKQKGAQCPSIDRQSHLANNQRRQEQPLQRCAVL